MGIAVIKTRPLSSSPTIRLTFLSFAGASACSAAGESRQQNRTQQVKVILKTKNISHLENQIK